MNTPPQVMKKQDRYKYLTDTSLSDLFDRINIVTTTEEWPEWDLFQITSFAGTNRNEEYVAVLVRTRNFIIKT